MRIKLLVGRAGLCGSWAPGETVEVDDARGERLVLAGVAVPAVAEQPTETAMRTTGESRSRRPKKGRQ